MRALPLTDASGPGGRPRNKRAPRNAFADWLATCGLTPDDVAKKLGVAVSSVYNLRNGYFVAGRELAIEISKLSDDAVPIDSWKVRDDVKPRRKAKRKK